VSPLPPSNINGVENSIVGNTVDDAAGNLSPSYGIQLMQPNGGTGVTMNNLVMCNTIHGGNASGGDTKQGVQDANASILNTVMCNFFNGFLGGGAPNACAALNAFYVYDLSAAHGLKVSIEGGSMLFRDISVNDAWWLNCNPAASGESCAMFGGANAGANPALTINGSLQAGGTQNITGCSLTAASGGAWSGTFTSGVAGTCTVTITPGFTAVHGWACHAEDLTTPADKLNQTAKNTTTCTISGTTANGDGITWTAIAY
jgi:hypothetical protein